MALNDVVRAAVALFAVVDPIGSLLIYDLLARGLPARGRIELALVSNLVAFAVLTVFVLSGTFVLSYLRISLASFEVAAGVLVAPTAFRLVESGEPLSPGTLLEAAEPFQRAIVPLAIPLLAGPAALATGISVAATFGRPATILGAAAVLTLSAALFTVGGAVIRLLGSALLRVLTRLVGILLMAIAVNFIVQGLVKVFG